MAWLESKEVRGEINQWIKVIKPKMEDFFRNHPDKSFEPRELREVLKEATGEKEKGIHLPLVDEAFRELLRQLKINGLIVEVWEIIEENPNRSSYFIKYRLRKKNEADFLIIKGKER